MRDGELAAVVLAAAGVRRLGLEDAVTEWFEPDVLLPAPGQGALAIQCRSEDEGAVHTLLFEIDDPGARAATTAERAFLAALDAGCTAPVGAYATVVDEGVHLRGLVASVDGRDVVRVDGEGEPEEVGRRLACAALSAGAERILEELRG